MAALTPREQLIMDIIKLMKEEKAKVSDPDESLVSFATKLGNAIDRYGGGKQNEEEPPIIQDILKEHLKDFNNPHQVTKAQLGLDQVDNTHDMDKPVSDAQAAADAAVLAEAKEYTDDVADTKLNIADYNDRFKGVYPSLAALESALPTGQPGDSAQVNEPGATDVVNYSWDDEEDIWVQSGSASSGATNTDMLPEGTSNLYFQTARVLATVLSGLSVLTGGAIVSTDTVLQAFGKIQWSLTDIYAKITDIYSRLPVNYTQVVYVNNNNPNSATIFDLNNPPVVNDDSLKNDVNNLYIGLDSSTWVYNTASGLYTAKNVSTTSTAVQIILSIASSMTINTGNVDTAGVGQHGRNVIIDNAAFLVTYNINAAITASFMKKGTGSITFTAGAGRTMVQVDGTAILSGIPGSTATITSVGTIDYLRISNA